ncbi:MAG: hypothetical protein Tsb0021_10440 [Chlamydiales bacterium]
MLQHIIRLHEESIHAPCYGLPYQWEETAPSREIGVLFGHWDTIHIALDALALGSKHGARQILNHLALQEKNGMIPGHLAIIDSRIQWTTQSTSPPLWPIAIHDYLENHIQEKLLKRCYQALIRQIEWFEAHRSGEEEGFYYLDYLDRFWESGVESGIRYDFSDGVCDTLACIDATSHMYVLYEYAALWSDLLNESSEEWVSKALDLKLFIQNELYDSETGYFFDQWNIEDPENHKFSFEGMWPVFVGAAAPDQAQRIIDEYLLNIDHFFTPHPLPTVSVSDPNYSMVSWRGPVYNSMVFWAAQGCLQYNRSDAAIALIERSLDATNELFELTECVWECYHPFKDDPRIIERPPLEHPLKNHLGHNPIIAMAKLWTDYNPRI